MSKPIIYQMLPRLWGNLCQNRVPGGTLEENGCGRFASVDEATFSYLRSIGVSHIWYTGILRHATGESAFNPSHPQFLKGRAGSPYAVIDAFDVNPYLASEAGQADTEAGRRCRMEEFEDLVRRSHEAGFKVLIDFIPNHVARDYGRVSPRLPAGEGVRLDGLSQDGRDALGHPVLGALDDVSVHWKSSNDFYYYPGEPLRLPRSCEGSPYREEPARATGNAFTPCPGINDWYETIRLNYCDFHTQTWDRMLEVLLFWAGKGVDGFRCDMVEMVPPAFFRWAIARVRERHPDILFIAEVYQTDRYAEYARTGVGFDYLYDKCGLYDILRGLTEQTAREGVHRGVSARDVTSNWQRLGPLQESMLNFLENHDEQRIASDFFAGDGAKGMAALHVSLLMNTAPFMVYAGQEAGERGMDAEGFSGRDGRTTLFDWWSVDALRLIWTAIHKKDAHQEAPLWDRYRFLLSFAARSRAIQEGGFWDLAYCQDKESGFDPEHHVAFLRHVAGETVVVLANFSDKPASVRLRIPPEALTGMGFSASDIVALEELPADWAVAPLDGAVSVVSSTLLDA